MRKRTAKILTGLAIIVVALGLLYGVAVGVSAYKLHQAYAALQKEGRPMNVADVIPPKVPDSENAALLYESAALLLQAQPSPKHDLLRYLGDLSNEFTGGTADANETAELEQLCRSDAVVRALATLEQAADRPSCRFDTDYQAGMGAHIPQLEYVRNLVLILGAQANLEARSGHVDSAWRIVQRQIKLADATRNDPVLTLQFARFSAITAACRTVQSLCRTSLPTPQQIHDTEQLFDGLDSIDPLVRAADGERLLLGEWVFGLPTDDLSKVIREEFSRSYAPEMFHKLLLWRVAFKPLWLADHAGYLRGSREYVHLLQAPDALDRTDTVVKRFFETQSHHLLTLHFLPIPLRTVVFHYRTVANIRITLTGLALLQYRKTNGDFPGSLEALGERNIQDPFSQKPLIYHREAEGFVLYDDRKDNGGAARQPRSGSQEYDIVWRFPGGNPNTRNPLVD
jgi:hypothetical protein